MPAPLELNKTLRLRGTSFTIDQLEELIIEARANGATGRTTVCIYSSSILGSIPSGLSVQLPTHRTSPPEPPTRIQTGRQR